MWQYFSTFMKAAMSKYDLSNIKLDEDYRCIDRANSVKLGEGAYGITYKAFYKSFQGDPITVTTALKLLKMPEDMEGTARKSAVKDFQDEILILRGLDHPNIASVLNFGNYTKINENKSSFYYFTKFEEGLHDIKKVFDLHQGQMNLGFVIDFLRESLNALKYCHTKKVLHLDIHGGNFLVRPRLLGTRVVGCSKVVLIDFGKAKTQSGITIEQSGVGTLNEKNELTTLGGKAMHPNKHGEYRLHPNLIMFLAKREAPRKIFDESDAARFDLWATAHLFRGLLDEGLAADQRKGVFYDCLDSIVTKLKNGGLRVEYSADQALIDLNNTLKDADAARNWGVRLASQVNVETTERFQKVIDTREFQRLRDVLQLGLTYLIYPSAKHDRFNHSLGAFSYGGRYVAQLRRVSSIFRTKYSVEEQDLIRLSVLLHDIGHYPFAHYFEEIGNLKIAGINWSFDHEKFGLALLSQTGESTPTQIRQVIDSRFGENALEEISLLIKEPLVKDIISGPMDCDKVDYLIRDAEACGVAYANNIDRARLIQSLVLAKDDESGRDDEFRLTVTEKGLAPFEALIHARYQMYSEVYWNKKCRAIAAMLKQALYLLCIEQTITPEEFAKKVRTLSDRELLIWLSDKLSAINPDAAHFLIQSPFVERNRTIYARVLTLTQTVRHQEHMIDKLQAMDYLQIQDLQTKLRQFLQEQFSSHLSGLGSHSILIDLPPAKEKDLRLPIGVLEFNENLAPKLSRLDKLSPLFQGDNARTLLRKSLKARVFVTHVHAPVFIQKQEIREAILKFFKIHLGTT